MSNKDIIMAEYDKKANLYQMFTQDVEFLLKRIIQEEGIICNAITGRLKERSSLSKKIDIKNGKYSTISDITDIAGIRIITYYSGDVDRIAELVEKEFFVDKENTIDKRMALEPDRFGYCSVHYVVGMSEERLKLMEYKAYEGLKCEVQIRTVLQHAWAEIEHDLGYKSEIAVPSDIRRNFSRLAGLLEIADKEFLEIREKLTEYKTEVEAKIGGNEFLDKQLDGVLISTLCSSNNDLVELNEKIAAMYEATVCEQKNDLKYCEGMIEHLRWLGINTLEQFLDFVNRNKADALEISKIMSERSAGEHKAEELHRTISIFYLCYAEVLNRYNDADGITDYLNAFYIGEDDKREDFADELLEIKNKIRA